MRIISTNVKVDKYDRPLQKEVSIHFALLPVMMDNGQFIWMKGYKRTKYIGYDPHETHDIKIFQENIEEL